MRDIFEAVSTTLNEFAPSAAAGPIEIAAVCRGLLIATDAEGAGWLGYQKPELEGLTRQIGFAFIYLNDVADVEPGERGRNRQPFIRR